MNGVLDGSSFFWVPGPPASPSHVSLWPSRGLLIDFLEAFALSRGRALVSLGQPRCGSLVFSLYHCVLCVATIGVREVKHIFSEIFLEFEAESNDYLMIERLLWARVK